MKERLDILLASLSLARSRSEAADLIRRGKVLVNGVAVTKPSKECTSADKIEILEKQYVGRGAHKLAAALRAFGIRPLGLIALDIGASTGGFTEVLLEEGAKHVYAVDSGSGQLAPKLLGDERVTSLEKRDIRTLGPDKLPEKAGIIVIDVSFISLTCILPAIRQFAAKKADVIALIKPQFEVGREHIGKNGIVTDIKAREAAMKKIRAAAESCRLIPGQMIESPIMGGSGNVEYLMHLSSEA